METAGNLLVFQIVLVTREALLSKTICALRRVENEGIYLHNSGVRLALYWKLGLLEQE